MGMLLTLYLITANVYNSVKAPPGRGFSYIEIWMVGAQLPILLALVEYGCVLGLKKYKKVDNKIKTNEMKAFTSHAKHGVDETQIEDLDTKIKRIDFIAMIICLTYFTVFNIGYWATAL
jgi:hypothetical protein